MRTTLLSSLLLCFGFAACADHAASALVADNNPQAPINQPDTKVITPSGGSSNSSNGGAEGGLGEGGSGSGGSGSGGNSGNGGSGSEAGSEGGGLGSGPGGGQGGQGGSPVPEPGTLLLVGSGIAGLAGAAMRRRQKKQEAR